MTSRAARGQISYHAGMSAEESVIRAYQARGCETLAKRWRGQGGELDIVVRDGASIVFVEVKKSSSFSRAVLHLSRRQTVRLIAAAQEFLGGQPDGLLSDARFDVALVDGQGMIEIRENVILS